jgi:hypothetical protein
MATKTKSAKAKKAKVGKATVKKTAPAKKSNAAKQRKDECGCEDICDCGDISMGLEDVVQNNNLMLTVLTEILLEKKIIKENDLKKKLEQIFKEVC